MSQAHLSTERLQALHDGEPGHHLELEHLASCSVCQEAFDDTRWTMLLMRLRSGAESGDAHPDRDELLAYQIGALGTGREASIREHLTRCRRCVSEYARVRVVRQRMRYSSPPQLTMQATMAQFRPRKIRRLGRLLIERTGESLSQSRLSASKASPSSPGASIEDSSWNVRVASASGAPEGSLQVTLASIDERRSTAKITIRILSEGRDEISAVTDAQGIAVLACPPGGSRLIVEVDPPLSVEIEFDD